MIFTGSTVVGSREHTRSVIDNLSFLSGICLAIRQLSGIPAIVPGADTTQGGDDAIEITLTSPPLDKQSLSLRLRCALRAVGKAKVNSGGTKLS